MDHMTLKEAKADWLIGINATRLFYILYHKTLNAVSYTHLTAKDSGLIRRKIGFFRLMALTAVE